MKTLNMVKKGVVIGGVAAALLLGSTIPGFGGAAAHAATTQIDYKAIVERNLSGVVGYVGSIANREDSEVREELMRGQNLVQLSGLTGSELLNRLTASLDQSIDLAARNDKAITKEELDRIKSDAAKRISTIITTGGYDDTKRENVDYDTIINRYMTGLVGYVGGIANRRDREVRELLQQGQSLTELSGLTGSELLNRLTGPLDQSIDLAARSDKSITNEKLDRIKSDAVKQISTIITTGGYDDTKRANVDYEIVIDRYMSGLVGYVGGIANRGDREVRELLQQGKSLTELSGLTGSELLNRLTAPLDQSIDLAARSDKTITNEKLGRIKSDAAKRISTIITTGGYDDTKRENVDYDTIIDRYMTGLVGYVGGIANRRDSEVRELLQQGKSLTELSGLTGSELLNRLTAPLDQSIDLAARSDKTITNEKLDRIKSDAAKRISTIITTGGYDDTKRENVDYEIIIDRYMSGIVGYVGGIANRRDSDVRELLQQGKSLTELSGLTGSELLNRLTAPLDQSIDLAARSDRTITTEKLGRIKSDAAKQISTIITTGGYDDTKREYVDYDTIVSRYMTGLIGYVGGIANRGDSEMRELLQQGKSLTEISGLTGSELLDRLIAPLDQSIDLAARSDNTITNEKLDRIKSDAAKQISTIISTGGY